MKPEPPVIRTRATLELRQHGANGPVLASLSIRFDWTVWATTASYDSVRAVFDDGILEPRRIEPPPHFRKRSRMVVRRRIHVESIERRPLPVQLVRQTPMRILQDGHESRTPTSTDSPQQDRRR